MTLQIGRFGIDLASGEVTTTSADGSTVRIEGVTAYSDFEKTRVLEQQLIGYVDQPDEDFVPVVWDETPQADGFYRVDSVSFAGAARLAPKGVMRFSVSLTKVQGFAAPLVEDTVLGALRPNSFGITSTRAVGLPSGVLSVDRTEDGTRYPDAPDFTRVGESGSALVYSAAGADSRVYSYYLPPADFYEAASTLRVGDPLRVAVGRQIPNAVSEWSLGNDLIQVRPSFGSRFDLQVRTWLVASSAWSGWETLTFGIGGSNLPAPHAITVMRNSPESVTIRLLAATNRTPVAIDVTLRRGARYVSVVFNQIMGTIPRFDCSNDTTVTTGGWYWFGTGYGGFVASPVMINGDGGHYSPGVFPNDSWQFCFGLDEVHSSGPDTITRNIAEYFWAATEAQSVVAQ